MKRLLDYISEAAFKIDNPVPGDYFDIELDTDTLIQTVVTELTESGDIIIDLDEHAIRLIEDSMMGAPRDSTSPIGGRSNDDQTDGHMSPINGNAFYKYDRKADPRTWYSDEHDEDCDCDKCSHDTEDKEDKVPGLDDIQTHGRIVGEAKYQGRTVPLGKPMQGDVKKSKVYVRKPNGKIVKVNFGDKTMTIKKSNPKRRKSFRARHNCANPGPRWKARYWSCRAW